MEYISIFQRDQKFSSVLGVLSGGNNRKHADELRQSKTFQLLNDVNFSFFLLSISNFKHPPFAVFYFSRCRLF